MSVVSGGLKLKTGNSFWRAKRGRKKLAAKGRRLSILRRYCAMVPFEKWNRHRRHFGRFSAATDMSGGAASRNRARIPGS